MLTPVIYCAHNDIKKRSKIDMTYTFILDMIFILYLGYYSYCIILCNKLGYIAFTVMTMVNI